MKLDILAIGAHPDDVELSCSGTLISHIKKGKKAGILDLTRGEMGTRGSVEIRDQEAEEAAHAQVLGDQVSEEAEAGDEGTVGEATEEVAEEAAPSEEEAPAEEEASSEEESE